MASLSAPTSTGRSALVTGSTSGIGLGIASALAQAGADVTLNGFGDPQEIERIRAGLAERTGVSVRYSGADMSKGDEVVPMVRAAEAAHGAVDILVNNAGIQFVAPIEEFPAAKWEAILAINLSHAYYAIHAALPGMRRRGFGRIVNLASAHGLVASPYKAAYVAAKHGMVGPDQGRGAGDRRGRTSPAMRSARASCARLWSRARSTSRPRRTACPASA